MSAVDDAIDMEDELEEEDTQKDKYLTFLIDNEYYSIDIKYVNEIVSIQKITAIPNIKKYIKGIINLRGNIIPVVEVRTRFKLPSIPYDEKTCIIVTEVDETLVGLIVDEVSEVLSISEDLISPPPLTNKGSHSRFIRGIGKVGDMVKIMLDIYKLLYNENDMQIRLMDQMN